jgi:3',5'-cyclic AMP phosphodiesterase CpdA
MALAFYLLVTPAQAFRFVFLADSRQCNGDSINREALKSIFHEITKISAKKPGNPIEFVIFGGDMACQGGLKNLEEWKSFVEEHLPTKREKDKSVVPIPLYEAKGNHELYGPANSTEERLHNQEEYLKAFLPIPKARTCAGTPAAYAFAYGQDTPCQFIILDTYEDVENYPVQAYVSPNQVTWLDRELDQTLPGQPTKTFAHRFVFGHCPVRPQDVDGYHAWRDYPSTNRQLAQKLQRHRVRAYFCGHDHTYDRKDNLDHYGFDQIIVGNAGAESGQAYNFMVVDVVSPQEVNYDLYLQNNGKWVKAPLTKYYPCGGRD